MDIHLEPRRAGTKQKGVWLTEEGRAAIQHWADENQTTFSAAIETLARIGMREPAATAIVPILLASVRASIAAQFQRLAKLLSFAALDSAVAARLTSATLRLLIQERAAVRPDDFEDTIFTEDPDDSLDNRVRVSWERLKTLARNDSVKALKTPLSRLEGGVAALFAEEGDSPDSQDASDPSPPAPGSRLPPPEPPAPESPDGHR